MLHFLRNKRLQKIEEIKKKEEIKKIYFELFSKIKKDTIIKELTSLGVLIYYSPLTYKVHYVIVTSGRTRKEISVLNELCSQYIYENNKIILDALNNNLDRSKEMK